MAAKGSFNMFSNQYDEPNKQEARNLFGNKIQSQNGQDRDKTQRQTKRSTFRNQIRLEKNNSYRKVVRQKLMKQFEITQFINTIQKLCKEGNMDKQMACNMIQDLRKNASQIDFCNKLHENTNLKDYLLNLYVQFSQQLPILQKAMMIQSFTYLTYYGANRFQTNQKQKLNDFLIKEIANITQFTQNNTYYLSKIIDLLMNIVSDNDENLNNHLMDTNIFKLITEKMTKICEKAEEAALKYNDQDKSNFYLEQLHDIRIGFLGALINLSDSAYHHNVTFFQFVINQLVNDVNYVSNHAPQVFRILKNYIETQMYQQILCQNRPMNDWLIKLFETVQEKFSNHRQVQKGKFQNIILTKYERETFYWYLNFLLTYIDYTSKDPDFQVIIKAYVSYVNMYYLSQFLIQSSQVIEIDLQSIPKNSKHVAKAIEFYEYLAQDLNANYKIFFQTTSERSRQDIINVFFNHTYFTSYRISSRTLSTLNKILSEDPHLLQTFMELRIFESIHAFLNQDMELQSPQQIINLIELLTLMIAADDDLSIKNNKDRNQLACLMRGAQFDKGLLRYQDYQKDQNRIVFDKILSQPIQILQTIKFKFERSNKQQSKNI